MTITGPSLARGKSKQDYSTPRDFLGAVERRFGPLDVDLAATAADAKAPLFITPDRDSLTVSWATRYRGNMWLNPPFEDIATWAIKCRAEAARLSPDSRILLLTPASIGANWFAEHVHGNAYVLALQGRLTFGGCSQPYPKDCMLSIFGLGLSGFDVWKWRSGT